MTASDKQSRWRIQTRTKREALKRYRDFLQRSLNCASGAFWRVGPSGRSESFVLLTNEDPVALKVSDGSSLFLAASQNFHYEVDRRWGTAEWKVKTDGYSYILSYSDTLDPELIAWQWHPDSAVKLPHAHVDIPSLRRLHIPTGRVSFESILRFAIEDLAVVPLRQDWEEILGETEGRFKVFQTWK